MKYEIKSGKDWEKAKTAKEVNKGFLHYTLKDGTIGLARPGTWRKQ